MPKEWSSEDRVGCAVCVAVGAFVILGVGLGVGLGLGLPANNSNSGTTTVIVLPYVTPPVAAAAPTVFVISISTQSRPKPFETMSFHTQALNPSTVISRFFNPEGGPSNLFGILKDLDGRVQGINQRMSQFACMKNAPTPYAMSTWGLNTTFYVQCSETWSGSQGQTSTTGFDQWGIKGSDFYLFENGGETHVAAVIYNFNATGGPDLVHVWYSVGCINRNGSHGVVEILAQPRQGIFEMTAAGGGLGFCGAHLKSNNATMNITGSEDAGICSEPETICVSAQNIEQSATCNGTVNDFQLRSIGRMNYSITGAGCHLQGGCYNGPSKYPPGIEGNVYLTGTGLDDTFFGPAQPFAASVNDHRPPIQDIPPSSTAAGGGGGGMSGFGTGTASSKPLTQLQSAELRKLRDRWRASLRAKKGRAQ